MRNRRVIDAPLHRQRNEAKVANAWEEYNAQRRAQGLGDDPDSPQFKEQQRMAGEGAINSKVLEELARYNQIESDFEGVGIGDREVVKLMNTPALSNGAPAPFKRNVRRGNAINQQRVHVDRSINPFNGKEEIIPIINSKTGKGLVSEFGQGGDLEGEKKASEYVVDHVMRLMGMEPQRGPKGKVDFIADGVGYDAQAQAAGQRPEVELFAKVIPQNRDFGRGWPQEGQSQSNMRAIENDVKDMLRQELDQGFGIKDSVHNLVNKELIEDDFNLKGKVYKDGYDKVIMPIQNRNDHRRNAYKDNIAIAPDDVVMYDLNEVRPAVEALTDTRELDVKYNAGDASHRPQYPGGRGSSDVARVKIRAKVPNNALQSVVDNYPLVAQMLAGI